MMEDSDQLGSQLIALADEKPPSMTLDDGSRVAVIGGGPAGSLFSFFLLTMAETVGIDLSVDIYEPRRFTHTGPSGCNHCGGIVSESLVQLLATEGINLPTSVVQRGIDSYVLHMDVGTVKIDTPLLEKRIAAVYRGNGPSGAETMKLESFDKYLLELAREKGAQIVRKLVNNVERTDDLPIVKSPDGSATQYDLIVLAVGVNSNLLRTLEEGDHGYRLPKSVKTFICEFHFGQNEIQRIFGQSMHVFLLDLPRLEFAALIPKGDYVTLCLLGDDIDDELVSCFLESPEVKACFPEQEIPQNVCFCLPRINVTGAVKPFSDRVVFIGDSGITRLYKDGIGAAYRTAKAAASSAVFHGVSEEAFLNHYWPALKSIKNDNAIGKFMFSVSRLMQKARFSRRAVFRMTSIEQQEQNVTRRMSTVLWDLFTGSAPYKEVFLRTLHPTFVTRLIGNCLLATNPFRRK